MSIELKKILLSLVVLSFAIMYCACNGGSASVSHKAKEEEPGLPVETTNVIRGSVSATYTGATSIEAEAEAEVVAKVTGVVKQIFKEEGQMVRPGQVLAKLEDEQLILEVNQAKSSLDKLINEHERNESLYKNKILSQEAFEKTKFEYHSQKATFDLARLKLNYTEIKAPIRGVISLRYIKLGNMVNLNQPVFRITDFDPLLAVLHIPEKEMSKMKTGFPATLSADALTGKEFAGKILRISPVVNAATGTFKVTVEVSDKTRSLKPGMFARVHIIYDTHANTLLVPKNAVITEDEEEAVFVVDGDKVIKQLVQIGYTNTSHVEILSGLNEGDTIVITGLGSLKDGSKISIVAQ